jgi:hypothetical protein
MPAMVDSARTVTVANEAELATVMAALAMHRELEDLGRTAADGSVLEQCEDAAVSKGREFIRSTLQATLQRRVDEAQKKGRPPGHAPVVVTASIEENRPGRSPPRRV